VDPSQHTILVVEDEFMIADTLAEILDWQGYRVVTAANGALGLQAVEREKPALVLLDYMMPVMDGVEMLEVLRSQPEHAKLPVILMTAAMKLPPGEPRWNALLVKPFSMAALEKAIREALGPEAE
jgi:two-component system, OmpR family, response regulator VicR